jgi:hypothetical protein
MPNPVNVGLYGHRFFPFLKNESTGSSAGIDRVQSFDPNYTAATVKYHELGRVGPIGATQSPPQVRVTLDQNISDSMELEAILTGKSQAQPAPAMQYHMGNILTYASQLTSYLLARNQDDTILHEIQMQGMSVSELSWMFTTGGACHLQVGLIGKNLTVLTLANVVHAAWPTLDNTSKGGIHGKDSRMWLTSGSGATSRQYRVQQATIRCAFPTQYVAELGNRQFAGTMADSPDVTLAFDVLAADDQPNDVLYTLVAGGAGVGGYDYTQPLPAFDARIRLFDPDNSEGGSVIRMWKVANVKATQGSPSRAQVRGLATMHYELLSTLENVAGDGGLTVSNRNDL